MGNLRPQRLITARELESQRHTNIFGSYKCKSHQEGNSHNDSMNYSPICNHSFATRWSHEFWLIGCRIARWQPTREPLWLVVSSRSALFVAMSCLTPKQRLPATMMDLMSSRARIVEALEWSSLSLVRSIPDNLLANDLHSTQPSLFFHYLSIW